ncbi:hypothetical protein [Micromonospora sp. WMMD710]|uniref:hypothetical protein n=1 Tax=Micromonospora sp. WMMD710 TaxID=3016085 RepID=UPI0024166797|nr:hypothetical protein [Micromonospora sp. WMMD710]MDG4760090.1 hypothetical protein [Micromonospora sp. WMMD710]
MNERGNSRTAGTNWQLMDVNSMWACLQDHDTANHWKQVAGWRKVCDLAQIHLGRLQEYRRGLASAWPPETSAASGTYLAQLDELIEKVRHTHDAAAANYTALSAATQAIGTTRAALRKIYEEYAAKLQQKQAYDATAADPKAIMGSRVTEPPVSDAELERLNVQARGMMFGLSGELQQAQATLQKPPSPPKGKPIADQANPDVYGGAIGPIIPPVVPVPVRTTSGSRQPISTQPVSIPNAPASGPVLGTAGSGSPGALTTAAGLGSTPPASTGPTSILGPQSLPPGVAPIAGPPRAVDSHLSPINRPTGADKPAPHATPPTPPRAMPPGGLIGGVPGAGLGQPDASTPPRRVNPVGGVIGGGGAGTGPSGGAGSRPGSGRNPGLSSGLTPFGGAPKLTNAGGGAFRPDPPDVDRHKSRPWDPDHPWETDQGVEPVVRPPDKQGPIDPGPAIGLDR